MQNLSRFDRRYAALWMPLAGVLLAGFALLAVMVIGILLVAGLGLAGSALNAWGQFGLRPATVPHLLIGLVFAPLLALLAGLLVVGGAMMVVIRVVAFESRRPDAKRPRARPYGRSRPPIAERVLWTRPAAPHTRNRHMAGWGATPTTGTQDDDVLAHDFDPDHD